MFPAGTQGAIPFLSPNSGLREALLPWVVCVGHGMEERSLSRVASGPVTSGGFGSARCLKGPTMPPHLLRGGDVRGYSTR